MKIKQVKMLLVISLALVMGFQVGCSAIQDPQPDDITTEVTVTGQILDQESTEGLSGATVDILSNNLIYETTTNTNGDFEVSVEITTITDLSGITVTLEGYTDSASSFQNVTQENEVVSVPPIYLSQSD